MIITTRKRLNERINRELREEKQKQMTQDRFESLEKRMFELESKIYELRMKTDPEFYARNTPTCGCVKEG